MEFQAEVWQDLGLDVLPQPQKAAASPTQTDPATASSAQVSQTSAPDLAEVAARIAGCQACPLAKTRKCTVPGSGPSSVTLMLVGEAPGADEDQQGLPFVGRAGQLLTKILKNGMGLDREEVFIANILKCRPPQNRNPTAAEIAACHPFLEEQIKLLQPRLLIALGRFAAQQLLATDAPLSQLRGRIHPRTDGPDVLVTYHPAYLLREPRAKAACWEDIQLGLHHLGMTPPPRRS